MNWKKPENYELKAEASLLHGEEALEMVIGDKIYIVLSLLLKDYHCRDITEWNQKYHSILTTEIVVICDGKKVVQEMKYDSGHAPDGMTVQTIANRICGSTGQTIRKKPERDLLFNMPVLEIVTPPTVMNIVTTHFSYITGKFVELEKKSENFTESMLKEALR
jgi:hypothetical protein